MSFLDWLLGPKIQDASAPPPVNAVMLEGDGTYSLAVVGESQYLRSLEAICGRRTSEGVNLTAIATLVLEDGNRYDPQAVRVDIRGLPVGYLGRDNARLYRMRLSKFGQAGARCICNARIRGGWYRDSRDNGDYGVQLDVNLSRERLAQRGQPATTQEAR